MKNKRLILSVAAASALVFGVAFFSAFLSKDSDDETIYTALAAKIQSKGLAAYNLRDVSIDPAGEFWKLSYQEGGNLLGLLAHSGVTYYDAPLYFNPPLFSAVLSVSHEIFDQPLSFLILKRNQEMRFRSEQFYAAFPNALFAVLFLIGAFFLGKAYFDEKTGMLAALFCLVSPVFLVAVFKVWSDLMAATLILFSFLIWRGRGRSGLHVVFSGLLFGLAVLTRTSAVFAVFIFFTKEWKALVSWVFIVLLTTAAWFLAVYQNYGTFFYFPDAAGAKDSLQWLKAISRPWYFYIFDLLYLSPFFAGAIFAVKKNTRLLALWFFSFLIPLSVLIYTGKPLGLADRYLLPCYPVLAVLAAKAVLDLKRSLPKGAIFLIVSILSVWSVRLAVILVLSRESLKFVPW